MKIGIFDSGLGGLVIAKAIIKKLPQYDYVYLGDTKRVPYGNRSQGTIYQFTKAAVEYLFQQDCQLVILACNTASAMALPRLQQEFLPASYPNRRILGVVIPTVEQVANFSHIKKVGVMATTSTVESNVYPKELKKLLPKISVKQQEAPLLVPLIENNAAKLGQGILKAYLQPLLASKADAVILGCTHYPFLKKQIRSAVGKKVKVISQDEIIAPKLAAYLEKHPEIEKTIGKAQSRRFLVTDINPNFQKISKRLFGTKMNFELVNYTIGD